MRKTYNHSEEKSKVEIEFIDKVDDAYAQCSDRTEQDAIRKHPFSTEFY
jgi:hypothetical protein